MKLSLVAVSHFRVSHNYLRWVNILSTHTRSQSLRNPPSHTRSCPSPSFECLSLSEYTPLLSGLPNDVVSTPPLTPTPNSSASPIQSPSIPSRPPRPEIRIIKTTGTAMKPSLRHHCTNHTTNIPGHASDSSTSILSGTYRS